MAQSTERGADYSTGIQMSNAMREQRVRLYLDNLRKAAKIDDRRAKVNALQRRVEVPVP